MIPDHHVLTTILTIAAVTLLLRALPFVLMDVLAKSQYLKFIGQKMPVGVMILLVVYTFIHVDFTVAPYGIPQIISTLLAAVLYWFLNNALAAISVGLAAYLMFVNDLTWWT
ncbi:branched-chain amino acid transporter permease [Photobacterium sp. 1_MG-2023]|uniref:branched-chain amino acid transporter permease n=1 Tax=Photobacterium sp. 1_MG-2023 TaxID=3062646 RepID=UPI0026E1F9DC|nr:AzlD domain-containing protein [Photobacterium sp. 1_MG-2023]MDO6705837.1 AzlD domain-containing protein [Photobacterium sp. 1_MG-2023]